MGLLIALPFAKVLATSLTLGSGATGGVFTPSLFIGATLGAAFGAIVGHVWSGASPQAAYALVGMGTVVAAVVNAPLTAVLLVCEFTHTFSLLPEVVVAVAASVMLARALHAESIYTLPLRVQGIDRDLLRRSPLARIRVRDVLTRDWPTLAPERTLRQAIALGRTSGRSLFPVVDDAGRFRGLLDLAVVTEGVGVSGAEGTLQFPDRPVGELATRDGPPIDPEATLHEVALALAGMPSFLLAMPVVERAGERYVGMLERAAILRGYSAAARLQERAQRQQTVKPPAGAPTR
jgi:CIC family chloride channel protein